MALEERLKNLHAVADLRALLVEEIGFDQADEALFFPEESELLRAEYPKPAVIAAWQRFSVILLVSASGPALSKARQRAAIDTLRQRFPFALFVFADPSGAVWHWVYPRQDSGSRRRILRRMEIEAGEVRLHTIAERLQFLKHGLGGCENAASVAKLVEQVFDVEAVSKAFYRDYAEQFKLLKDGVKKSNLSKADWIYQDDRLSRYVQLLMGRVLFLHFIEKKGWLNNDRDFIRTLHAPYRRGEKADFYGRVMSQLFFKALNQPGRKKTIGVQEYDIRFLNGGLFEERREFEEHDSLLPPIVPDEALSNFLVMLGRYNFTVDESTPLDQTVGIDPEMLGKVFENLLEEESRHKSGTYYTPRTIVEYMCRETLFQYLNHGCGIVRAAYEDLYDAALEGRKANLDQALADRVEGLLDRVRVLDPAVGSGAFLLGTLQEIVTLKESLARSRGESEERLRVRRAERKERVIHDSLYGVDISPPAIEIARLRLWLALVVDEDEPKALPNFDYHIVRGDTLRTLFEGEPVLPVQAKPSLTETNDWLKPASNPHTEALLRYMDQLYSASGEAKAELRRKIRHALKDMIEVRWDALMADLDGSINQLLTFNGKTRNLPTKEKHLEQYRQLENRLAAINDQRRKLKASLDSPDDLDLPFTPLQLYFAEAFTGERPGFDIVIANPPYVRMEEIKHLKPALKEEFGDFVSPRADLYTYFYKRGLELLKEGGHLCFIAPNKFMRAGYGKNTRALLTNTASPRVIVDFGDTPVFDATTYPAIVLVEKTPPSSPALLPQGEGSKNPSPSGRGVGVRAITVAVINDAADIERIAEAIEQRNFTMQPADLSQDGWTLESPAVLGLMQKLRAAGTPLGEYVRGRIYYGIKTGLNEAFVIDAATRERLIAEDPKSADLIKPWLRGRDIRKWQVEWAGLYVIVVKYGFHKELENYPAILKHLSQFEQELKNRGQCRSSRSGSGEGQHHWLELDNNPKEKYLREFEQPKIVFPDLSPGPRFALDQGGLYLDTTAFMLTTTDPFVLAVLNSTLMTYFFLKISASVRGSTFRFKKQYVDQLPILPATENQKLPIAQRVQVILADSTSPDVSRLEAEINDLVFDLYGLTDEERQLVQQVASVAQAEEPCQDESKEVADESDRSQEPASPPEQVAGQPRRRGKPARGVSAPAAEPDAALHGLRAGTGKPGTPAAGAGTASTTPLDATRQLDTAAGALTYGEVAERLALRIIECLEEILASSPEAIRISAEWIANIHRCIAGELFPDWAGKFRTTDVQVGSHLPPPGHDVPMHVRNFCLDLEERLRHLAGIESLAELLAWVDWRFQWIHPLKDFNGRVGRILLTALLYKLKLPPVDPAPVDEAQRVAYLAALRAADRGNLQELTQVWMDRLSQYEK